MGKDKYDAEAAASGEHSADAGIEFEASSPEEARQQADEFLDEIGAGDPNVNDVSAVTNERTGEETRFD